MRIGPGRTGVRQGTVAGLFGRSACRMPAGRFRQLIFSPVSSPDLGAGDYLRPADKREPARGGRAKMRRSVLAFPYSLRSSFVCPFSRSPPSCSLVVVCGISYRFACRLVHPSRLSVSLSVCLFLFPPWVVSFCRLVLSVSLCVSSSYSFSLASVSSLTRFVSSPFVFVSSPFIVIIVIIVVVRVSPLLPLLSFSFSSSVSPRLASHASLAFPYCRPLDVPYETTDDHDVPLIYSPGCFPRRSQWETDGKMS